MTLLVGGGHWLMSHHADPPAIGLYLRHYSARHYKDGRKRTQFCPPGEKMVLLTELSDALFVWHHPVMARLSGQVGVSCTIFRNESPVRSSDLIREACDPGYCFKQAGWKTCGRNADGRLTILELLPQWARTPVAA